MHREYCQQCLFTHINPTMHFCLEMKSSILKFELTNVPPQWAS